MSAPEHWRAAETKIDPVGPARPTGFFCWPVNFSAARRRPLASRRWITENDNVAQSSRQLEVRLERLEQELGELKAMLSGKAAKSWYEEIVGCFKGDEAIAEITRLGRLTRQGKIKQ